MGVAVVGELKPSVSSGKRAFRHSSSTRQTAEWPLSDATADLTVEVRAASFSLHKFPLISKSGKLRSMLSESRDTKTTRIALHAIPGGPDSFESAAKFCYGLDLVISLCNVAALHCTAHYLQMTEHFSENNLEIRTEVFLREVVFSDAASSTAVLHHCEKLLPFAEEVGLVGRLTDVVTSTAATKDVAASMAILSPDLFGRIMVAFNSKGLKQDTAIKMLIDYAHSSPHGIPIGDARVARGSALDGETSLRKQRVLVETMVGLLPCTQSRTSHAVPLVFLSGLLKAATVSSASAMCTFDLERRIGLQLHRAILEDILIPANANQPHQLYDTESVARVFAASLNMEEEEEEEEEDGEPTSDEGKEMGRNNNRSPPKERAMAKVAKLMDCYLAEIALDSNLMPNKFIALAEMLPDHARMLDDGLYRAVDIFLKVHPNMTDSERRRLCKTIDCQKLSQEACNHAAQNERLPVQMAVQVLYFEQLRLRNAMNGVHDRFFVGGPEPLQLPKRSSSGAVSPRDNYASVRRENRELKLEVARLRMRLTELEKEHAVLKRTLLRSTAVRKACRWLVGRLRRVRNTFTWLEREKKAKAKGGCVRFPFQRRRRHSSTPRRSGCACD